MLRSVPHKINSWLRLWMTATCTKCAHSKPVKICRDRAHSIMLVPNAFILVKRGDFVVKQAPVQCRHSIYVAYAAQ